MRQSLKVSPETYVVLNPVPEPHIRWLKEVLAGDILIAGYIIIWLILGWEYLFL